MLCLEDSYLISELIKSTIGWIFATEEISLRDALISIAVSEHARMISLLRTDVVGVVAIIVHRLSRYRRLHQL